MLYDIQLKIEYIYPDSADAGRHIARITPADITGTQRTIAASVTVTPDPVERLERMDFFGNRVTEVFLDQPYDSLWFEMKARVERQAQPVQFDTSASLEVLARELANSQSLDPFSPHHFCGNSPKVPVDEKLAEYARENSDGNATAFEIVNSINASLHRDMRFKPEATSVETPLLEAFENRHGVCQDFSHIMIGCLRAIGIPAGYVSGYLRTIPPQGQPRLEGADAMHAWVTAWCGNEMGWIEIDPTNAIMAGADHIMVAKGRDYFDVAPVKGVMRSAGQHTSDQSVDVIPVG